MPSDILALESVILCNVLLADLLGWVSENI
jgi:hypothetical protein